MADGGVVGGSAAGGAGGSGGQFVVREETVVGSCDPLAIPPRCLGFGVSAHCACVGERCRLLRTECPCDLQTGRCAEGYLRQDCATACAPDEVSCGGARERLRCGPGVDAPWCADFSELDPCEPGSACSGGACIATCTDDRCRCAGELGPACGDDGRTYWNECLRSCAGVQAGVACAVGTLVEITIAGAPAPVRSGQPLPMISWESAGSTYSYAEGWILWRESSGATPRVLQTGVAPGETFEPAHAVLGSLRGTGDAALVLGQAFHPDLALKRLSPTGIDLLWRGRVPGVASVDDVVIGGESRWTSLVVAGRPVAIGSGLPGGVVDLAWTGECLEVRSVFETGELNPRLLLAELDGDGELELVWLGDGELRAFGRGPSGQLTILAVGTTPPLNQPTLTAGDRDGDGREELHVHDREWSFHEEQLPERWLTYVLAGPGDP